MYRDFGNQYYTNNNNNNNNNNTNNNNNNDNNNGMLSIYFDGVALFVCCICYF